MWSLVNAIGTRRMFFQPLSQSPLIVSSVWGPSQGIGPTCEQGGWMQTGTTPPVVSTARHSPLPPPFTARALQVWMAYTCFHGFWYFHTKAGILLEVGRMQKISVITTENSMLSPRNSASHLISPSILLAEIWLWWVIRLHNILSISKSQMSSFYT